MKTPSRSLLALVLCTLFLGAAPAFAFPKTKERADLTLTFALTASDPTTSTASGTATIHVTRLNGVETDGTLDFSLTGLADGTYGVSATKKGDATATPVSIGSIVLSGGVSPATASLSLPTDLPALAIDTLSISDATPTIVLSGTATEVIASWLYFGNRPLVPTVAPAASAPVGHGRPVSKKVHGHVLIQAAIKADVEKRRKFLLVGLGLPAATVLTVNLDGVAVGTVTTTARGKAMLTRLDGDFRLAGVRLVTLTDSTGASVAEADFFPSLP